MAESAIDFLWNIVGYVAAGVGIWLAIIGLIFLFRWVGDRL